MSAAPIHDGYWYVTWPSGLWHSYSVRIRGDKVWLREAGEKVEIEFRATDFAGCEWSQTMEEREISMKRNAVGLMVLASLALAVAGCLVTIPEIEMPEGKGTPTTTTTTTTTVPPEAVVVPAPTLLEVGGALVDPPGFDDAYVAAHASYEECGMDTATGVFRFRCTVIKAASKKTCILSTPFVKHFRKGPDGSITMDDNFLERGGVWHIRGFAADEPQPNEQNPKIVVPGNVWKPGDPTWSVWEVRLPK